MVDVGFSLWNRPTPNMFNSRINQSQKTNPPPPQNKFNITNILNSLSSSASHSRQRLSRPWEDYPRIEEELECDSDSGGDSDEEINVVEDTPSSCSSTVYDGVCPLKALFIMTNRTIIDGPQQTSGTEITDNVHPKSDLNDYNSVQTNPLSRTDCELRRKRKSRTAFTNRQLFELERRFVRQKYLLPADRDSLANTLGLTNAQVITWFQNRRAKLKRDLDELRADMDAVHSIVSVPCSVTMFDVPNANISPG